MRKTLDQTWQYLESMGQEMPRLTDGAPHLPSRMPNFDDEDAVNATFFRSGWEGTDLSELTLPRTYFGRSSFQDVSFRGSELVESRMCWNDFIRCDFSEADLSRCDMRAVRFEACIFRGADLSGADLRRSSFDACILEGAKLAGAIAHRHSAAEDLVPLLTKAQREEVRWVMELGDEPPGG